MIWKLIRLLFHLKPKQKIDRVPRSYAPSYNRKQVTREEERIMAATQARSPKNVRLLMEKFGVETADELLQILPSRQRKANPRQRLQHWLMRLQGRLPYDPVIPGALRRLEEAGRLRQDSILIYRSHYPYRKGGEEDAPKNHAEDQ